MSTVLSQIFFHLLTFGDVIECALHQFWLSRIVADVLNQLMNPAYLFVLTYNAVLAFCCVSRNCTDFFSNFGNLHKIIRMNNLVPSGTAGHKFALLVAGDFLDRPVKKDRHKVHVTLIKNPLEILYKRAISLFTLPQCFLHPLALGDVTEYLQLRDAAVRITDWGIEQIISFSVRGAMPLPSNGITVEDILTFAPWAFVLAIIEILITLTSISRPKFPFQRGIYILYVVLITGNIYAIFHRIQNVGEFVLLKLQRLFSPFAVCNIQTIFNHLNNISIIVKNRKAMNLYISGITVFIVVDMLDRYRFLCFFYHIKRAWMILHSTRLVLSVSKGMTGYHFC